MTVYGFAADAPDESGARHGIDFIPTVNSIAVVNVVGTCVADSTLIIRPVLRFNKNISFKTGDSFLFGGKTFRMIDERTALCVKGLGIGYFRRDFLIDGADDYDKSDIKKYLKHWFKEAVQNARKT